MYIYFLQQNFSKRKAREETRVPVPRNRKAENTRMKRCKVQVAIHLSKKDDDWTDHIIVAYLHK